MIWLDVGITLLFNPQKSGCQRFKIQIRNITNITSFTTNYHLAWTMGVIDSYPVNKFQSDKITIFDLVSTNPLGIDATIGTCHKAVCPTLNSGIHRLTLSFDLLATSQYINGHRTAKVAEFQIAPSTAAHVNPIVLQNSFEWQKEPIYFMMGYYDNSSAKTQVFPDDNLPTNDLKHYTTVLPDVYTSFMFNNGVYGNWFDLVML